VEALRSRGARFKVAARNPEKAKAAGSDVVRHDWDDFSSYLPALKGVEKLFLLTPTNERQLSYVLQMMAAAKRAGIRHIVKLSAIGAEMEPGISIVREPLEENTSTSTFPRKPRASISKGRACRFGWSMDSWS
jgi:uncharacterized protein YbjT (DUF2867 family)